MAKANIGAMPVQIPSGTIELLTLALVVITAIYSYFNYLMAKRNGEMVEQMKAQHEAFLAPVIAIALKIKHGTMICLLVSNRGQSPATNLRLSLDRDFHQFGKSSVDENLRNFPMFQETIPSFAPGEELFTFLVQGHELNDFAPAKFAVLAKFEFGGKTYEQAHNVNLTAYFRTAQDRNELLDEATKIRKALEDIAKK
jgi:hypothetical protein